jgi:hypothetical protein
MGGSVWVNPKPSVPPQRGVLCPPGFSAATSTAYSAHGWRKMLQPPRKIGRALDFPALTARPPTADKRRPPGDEAEEDPHTAAFPARMGIEP